MCKDLFHRPDEHARASNRARNDVINRLLEQTVEHVKIAVRED